jgi:hypothetical protein
LVITRQTGTRFHTGGGGHRRGAAGGGMVGGGATASRGSTVGTWSMASGGAPALCRTNCPLAGPTVTGTSIGVPSASVPASRAPVCQPPPPVCGQFSANPVPWTWTVPPVASSPRPQPARDETTTRR